MVLCCYLLIILDTVTLIRSLVLVSSCHGDHVPFFHISHYSFTI